MGGGNGGVGGAGDVGNDPASASAIAGQTGEGDLAGNDSANAITGTTTAGSEGQSAPASGEGELSGNDASNAADAGMGEGAFGGGGDIGQGAGNVSAGNASVAKGGLTTTADVVTAAGKGATLGAAFGLPGMALGAILGVVAAASDGTGNFGDAGEGIGPSGNEGQGRGQGRGQGDYGPQAAKATPASPTDLPQDAQAARVEERKKAAERKGRASTLLTGGQGLTSRPNVQRSSLLGF